MVRANDGATEPTGWLPPLIGTMVYPGLVVSGEWAISGYRESGSFLLAGYALLTVLLGASIPVLALRALLLSRDDERAARIRCILYLMITVPSLFSFTYTLSGIVGVRPHISAIWISVWIAIGVMLYQRRRGLT